MRIWIRSCQLAFAAILVCGSIATAADDSLTDAVAKIAAEAIDSGKAVGISVGIAKGDKILLAKGYGWSNVETKTPATAKTVFRIGSITKQFTAAAIVKLAEQEKLTLDDPLTKHLPDFPEHDPPVTLRHLLQHTSGMQSFTSLPTYRLRMRQDSTHDEMLARFKDLPYHFQPGDKFKYCNSGYYLLGVVVEKASGVSYEEYLQQQFFKPLKLESTHYDRSARLIPHRAQGYRRWNGQLENSPYLSMTQPYAAGALAANVEDLIRWQRGLVEHRAVTASSFQLMTKTGETNDGKPISYGLGLFLKKTAGRETITHGGGINGFRSDLTYYPDGDYTIAVLANSENARPGAISRAIAGVLFQLESGESK